MHIHVYCNVCNGVYILYIYVSLVYKSVDAIIF